MAASPRLILFPGRDDERVFPLAEGETLGIGRAEDNRVFVLAKTLSRHHARLELRAGAALLHDLGSRNGTWVDGVRVEGSRPLAGGERIRCGGVVLRYLTGPSPDTPPERPRSGSSAPRMVRSIDADLSRLSMGEILSGGRPGAPGEDGERLRILLKVSQLLSSPMELDELLQRILNLAFEILDIDRGALLLADEESDELVPRAVRSRDGAASRGPIWSRHIVDYVRRHSVATVFADAQTDPRLGGAKSILRQSICASMCAPLKPADEVLGVLYVDNLSIPDRFTADDLDFLSAFANQAAIAIENSYLRRSLEREAVTRNNLLRFFPPATIGRILEESQVTLGAQETEITALFCDLTDFTALSSQLAPREVVDLLNAYFPAMAEEVFRYQGTLEKYIGDALMAVWGAPFRHDEDADRALEAAVRMQRAMAGLNARRRPGWPELSIHVGLSSGTVAAGNIGTPQYLQYATIGDATNVAARVCEAATAGEVLLTAGTARRLRRSWPLAELEARPLKGKQEPVELYRLLWRQVGG